jgi:predicted nucleotidyltransferase
VHPTPFPELNQVLETLVARIADTLCSAVVGVYLQGSFAVGDFDDHSDVDFVVLVRDALDASQVEGLQGLHDRTYQLDPEWARHLEGSYFALETFRDPAKVGTELWYLDHGARGLIMSDHCNTLLVRWIVREQGVVLFGPPPRTLIDPIPTASVREEIRDVMRVWGHQILADPTRYANRFYQGFILLNYCRMLHDLRRGYPGSKREGAEWAKSAFDSSWTPLIDRAWATRPDPARKVREPADAEDFRRTLAFVELAIDESRRIP